MLGKIKSFYNKENFNISDGLVDPFEYHKTWYYILKAFNVTGEESKKRPYFNQNLFIFLVECLALISILNSLYHGIDIMEITAITEAGTYLIIFLYATLILSCTKLNLPQYSNFLQAVKDDFNYVCTTGRRHREKFFKNQLETWKVTIQSLLFTGVVTIGMILFAIMLLLFYLATHKPGEEGSRPLIFPFWFSGVDLNASPTYEILFIFCLICVCVCTYNYSFMMQVQIVWVRHIATKADLVIWNIEDLLVAVNPTNSTEEKQLYATVIKKRMREIVIQHQSMYRLLGDYSDTYKKLLMWEQMFSGHVTCFTAYCIVEKSDEFQMILVLLFLSSIILYFIPSYLCTYLAIKINSICDACWNTPFWNSAPIIRPYFVLIMQRSLRPLNLHPPGFQNISLETFAQKMTAAYSLFNMLRQTNLSDI